MPRSVLPDIGQQLAHHIQLMIARKNQRFAVLQVHKLLDNVHHTVLLKDILPQIRCRVTVWVCRIALAAVVSGSVGALVKGQEIGVLPGELCGHPHLGVIHAEIGQNALVELEAKLPRVAVIHPLPLGIIHRLAGVLVFSSKANTGMPLSTSTISTLFLYRRRSTTGGSTRWCLPPTGQPPPDSGQTPA